MRIVDSARPKGLSSLAQYRALLLKDLRQEIRTREMLTSMAVYALLVLTIYGAALQWLLPSRLEERKDNRAFQSR